MKKIVISAIAIIALLILGQTCYSTIIWQENFDGYTRDYNCSLADCSVNPGLPSGYVGFKANTLCPSYGKPNSQIVADAERSHPGQTNKRGFRINIEEQCPVSGDSCLRKDLGKSYSLIYLRWYQRNSSKDFGQFQKLFRLKKADGTQIFVPEYYTSGGITRMNLWDSYSGSNHYFMGYSANTEYTVNTWVSYEIKIDLVNKRAEFWVNGISKGTLNATWWPSDWAIRYIEIGGNQLGHKWVYPVEQYRDYDDIVVADSYVGPSGVSVSEITAPTNLRITN